MQLRNYQQDGYDRIHQLWNDGIRNVLAVYPTGAGKTVLLAAIVNAHHGVSCVVAHRQELVAQISIALARNGVSHNIIAAKKTISVITRLHQRLVGRTYYDPTALVAVAGVDTLVSKKRRLNETWVKSVSLVVMDEAHHVLTSNKWGRAWNMFPGVKRGLGVTATPLRADGAGLGSHADGVFDEMVVGPNMRDLIDMGFLTDYRIVEARSNVVMTDDDISKTTGDYKQQAAALRVHESSIVTPKESQIVGDIVQAYQQFAAGMLTIVFLPSVDDCITVAAQFNAVGISAEAVSARPEHDAERVDAIERFRRRETMVLLNVDLFGEGFDLPAIECVQMARPTQSYGLFVQQFGRALRLMDGKDTALIIDHVGNIRGRGNHGLPDAPRTWSLDRREKRSSSSSGGESLQTCTNPECCQVFTRYLKKCPYCHTTVPAPTRRDGPEFVDGDLYELDASTLAALRAQIAEVDSDVDQRLTDYVSQQRASGVPEIGVRRNLNLKRESLLNQRAAIAGLRDMMAAWAGYHRAAGRSDDEIFRIFYITFGVDWLSAQALDADAANSLITRVLEDTGNV